MKPVLTLFLGLITMVSFAQQLVTIPEIQGSGDISPYENSIVTTTGVVTGVFLGTGSIGDYFIQDPVGDSNSSHSRGSSFLLLAPSAGSTLDDISNNQIPFMDLP